MGVARRTRILKATYPGAYGFTVIACEPANLELTGALPTEYLERLLLQNQVFGDGIRLEGVAMETRQPVIVTSQPTLVGQPVELDEIEAFMRGLWFQPLPHVNLGHPGALAFYRDLDEVAAFDAHPANFVKDQNGVILPIDLIMVHADPALQAALRQPVV